ncbi:MAG: NADH:ubiquinone reductase (Na(+)-transporting) subunit C [Rikenellaceae bacterium]|nr:NADH:ubiquinone reductase (Na(+)-transporting) subunit C [Rikenellaceae bacterium]
MNKNSNLYIVVYATVMVVVVATLLALAAMSLQSRQQANMLGEKKSAILSSLDAATENYDEFITALVVNAQGEVIEGDALELLFDMKGAFEAGTYPIFKAQNGRVVVPVYGSGLWGPIWGYLALEPDMNTVVGIVLDHSGETPGLGAEIATPKHQAQYVGKTIFEGEELVAITLRKGGAQNPAHEVDAISGGTKTSDGVSLMLLNSLNNYLPYLKAQIAAAAPAVEEPVAAEEEAANVNIE